VLDVLVHRAAAHHLGAGALTSVRDLVGAGEPDTDIDHLVHYVNHARLPLHRSEYDRLAAAALAVGEPGSLEDLDPRLLTADPDGTCAGTSSPSGA
jgi:hypothetical protein